MLEDNIVGQQVEELQQMGKHDYHDLFLRLEQNQQKIMFNEAYYNEGEDLVWIKNYYSSIDFDSDQLLENLNELVSKSHIYKHPYFISKDHFLYTWVDLHEDGYFKGIYSGQRKAPISVIEEDLKTIQKRSRKFNQIERERYQNKYLQDKVVEISRKYRFNTEHVIPQSWFNAKEPMKGDLHHLFVCEPLCNSVRSNFPFTEFASQSEHSSNFCGSYEFNRFEPQHGKGEVARATFYFLLRYPNKIMEKYRRTIDVELLKKWHHQFPAGKFEKHRNKAIFEIQGNRNPFIDYPNLIDQINFI
ncbi:endonuclease I family protein [Bacillaceae bacterium W0354]